jgi:hypothetical protein
MLPNAAFRRREVGGREYSVYGVKGRDLENRSQSETVLTYPKRKRGGKSRPVSLDRNEYQALADILATPELVTMLVSLVSRSKSVPMMKLITATMIGYQRP